MAKKVFVSGCYDLLHSGHVEFFRQAAQFGDLYVGIEYVVLQRTPAEGLKARSSTDLKAETCRIPTRLDLAGTWIDQPYVSYLALGWPWL